jgi:glycosyltransferase involved in cell wall biosynthesis
LPTTRIRRSRRWQRRIEKLRPISLQAGSIDIGRPDDAFAAKNADVFFAGAVELNSTVRSDGLRQLEGLAARGLRIDMPAERLAQDEFYRRMSRAWLAWSPSGLGWDCYRHYEAPQCLTVPVINYPTILRNRPLQDGVHAIYYPPEGDGLARAIENALVDKERLKRMALAGREHVQSHHVGPAFCDRILKAALHDETD